MYKEINGDLLVDGKRFGIVLSALQRLDRGEAP